VAVSLPGIERREVVRGEALVAGDAYPISFRLDIALDELEPIADGARLYVHIGTAGVPARVVRIGERWAQLRLSSPVVASRGDRVVLRGETTVGGGTVLDPAPPRHRDDERMDLVERGEIAATVHAPVLVSTLRHLSDGELTGLEQTGPWVFSADWLAELEQELRERISSADPIDPGVSPPPDAWAVDIVPLLGLERRGAKLYLPGSAPSLGRREEAAKALEQELDEAGVRATKVEDGELVRFLAAKGTLVTLGDGYAIGSAAYDIAREVALRECRASGEITLARFRDLVGTGRRDAQLLLERFDRDGLTRRVGDRRVLRSGAPRTGGGRSPAGRAS
jgi:selenocysteine-specific elongation factor